MAERHAMVSLPSFARLVPESSTEASAPNDSEQVASKENGESHTYITVESHENPEAATTAVDTNHEVYTPIPRSLLAIFLTFLSIGFRGFGGPVAQIALMKQQFVLDEKWMRVETFNRVYAFYQAVPGPEAAELAVFFGYVSNGFVGGILGGLGFILPGFGIMLLLSYLYATYGLSNIYAQASFDAVQPCVTAMIFVSLRKLADHAFQDAKNKEFSYRLGFLGFLGLLMTVMHINFFITLAFGGIFNTIAIRRNKWAYALVILQLILGIITYVLVVVYEGVPSNLSLGANVVGSGAPSLGGMFLLAFLAGLLTFGGAYTAIPFIQQDAVFVGHWITNQQFLDGIALTNLVPTPLVMFMTFVGYLTASWAGAILMTIGIFLPAFTFSLFGHHVFNRILNNTTIMPFLDGITATMIGIVLVTACNFAQTSLTTPIAGAIFFIAITILTQIKGQYVGPILIAVCAVAGQALFTSP